ncbi:unnamed protein product [Effrenium voratum]|nr:unnamed protein product [Effrenium voratum]
MPASFLPEDFGHIAQRLIRQNTSLETACKPRAKTTRQCGIPTAHVRRASSGSQPRIDALGSCFGSTRSRCGAKATWLATRGSQSKNIAEGFAKGAYTSNQIEKEEKPPLLRLALLVNVEGCAASARSKSPSVPQLYLYL